MQTPQVQQLLTREEGLASRLKRARGDMLSKHLAEQAGWVQSKISKIEAGRQLPTREDLELWAAITGADDDALTIWQAMLVEAQQARRDWAARIRQGGQTAIQQGFAELVEQATQLSFFETTFIPRFFQVPGYTRSVLTWVNDELGLGRDIEEAVAVRQADVRHLYSGERRFDMLITEPVLHWRHESMPVAVMRQQLDRLLSINGLDNVRLGIIPLGAPVRTLPVHSFEIYGDVLMLETFYDEQRIDDDEKVALYRHTLDRLWSSAVTGEQADRLIQGAIHALPRT